MANDEQQTNTESGDKKLNSGFDLTGLLLDYLSNWKWFVVSIIALMIGAYYYISTIIPTYQVSASIYLKDESTEAKQNAISFGSGDPLLSAKNFIDETEIEILKSRNNLVDIVDSLGLMYNYYNVGRMRDVPIYNSATVLAELDSASLKSLTSPIEIEISAKGKEKYNIKVSNNYQGQLEEKELNATTLPAKISISQGDITFTRSETASEMTTGEKIVIVNPMSAAGALSGALNITFAEKSTTILHIKVYTDVIRKGEDIIRTLVDFYNKQIIEDKNRSAIQTEAFILDRLKMIAGELRDVEDRLKDYRQQHNITNLDAQASMNLAQQNSQEVEIAQVTSQIELLNMLASQVSNNGEYAVLPAMADNAALQGLIETYNTNVGKYNRLIQGKNVNNPDQPMLTAQEELNALKSRILSSINSARRNLEAKRNTLYQLSNRNVGQLASVPTIDKGLNEIFREQQVKVNIYTFLLQRREEIALQKTLATPTARLIDNPMGSGPVSPDVPMIYGVALLIALLIPAAIIYLKRLIFPIFKDQDELERMTNVPILGEICIDKENAPGTEIVVGENVSTPIAELFRLLRNNIRFTRNGADNKVIAVTSAISGEGKTFIATNLAMTYALSGKRVIVVGMDIRRPALAHRFGLSNQRGVTTFLSGQERNIAELVIAWPDNPNLHILTAGPIPPNPNELLLSDNMQHLMDQLRHDYDYVIIDTAPIGIISDSFLIIPYTDIQLFVTRASYSTKKGLKVLHSAIAAGKLKSVYIVLNSVNMSSGSYVYRRYGYYGYYHKTGSVYGYGYGYGKQSGSKSKQHHHHHSHSDKAEGRDNSQETDK